MKFLNWIVLSSADPAKLSLTVKGLLTMAVPFIITIAGLTNIHVPDEKGMTLIIDGIATAVQIILGIIGLAATLIGVIRKIVTTYNGTNEVLAAHERGDLY